MAVDEKCHFYFPSSPMCLPAKTKTFAFSLNSKHFVGAFFFKSTINESIVLHWNKINLSGRENSNIPGSRSDN